MDEQAKKEKQPHPTDPLRYADGTLKAGHQNLNTSGGRRRTKYVVAFEAKCSPEEFGLVVAQAKLDAVGRRYILVPKPSGGVEFGNGTEPDPDSTAIGRNAARTWLSKTIGLAGIDDDPNGGISAGVYAEYDDLSDGQSAAIRRTLAAELARLESGQDSGDSADAGISGSSRRSEGEAGGA
jgi:hypothetical protein